MKRVLLITPASNLEALAEAARSVEQEADGGLCVDNILTYQLSDLDMTPQELDERLDVADVVIFDIRDAFGIVQQLRSLAERAPNKTLIPLNAGTLSVASLCRMGSFSMERALARTPMPMGLPSFRRMHHLTAFIEKLAGVLPIGPVGHARNWVRLIRCWATGSAESLDTLMRIVARDYCDLDVHRGDTPAEQPSFVVQHPQEDWAYGAVSAYLKNHPSGHALPNIALLYHGGLYRDVSGAAAVALIDAFGDRANVMPIATDGVEGLEAVRQLLFETDGPSWDALIDLTWYRLDGGPLGGNAEATLETLASLDVPVFSPLVLHGRELQRWMRSPEGPSAVEACAAVALPELDGAMGGQALAGLERFFKDGLQVTRAAIIPGSAERIAARVLGWARLRHLRTEQRKVAIVLPDPTGVPGKLGFDVHLDISASLTALFARLATEGYDVGEAPADPLGQLLEDGLFEEKASSVWRGAILERENYALAYANLPETARRAIEVVFGAPPGNILVSSSGLRLRGRWFGNIFCGFQPARSPKASQRGDDCDDPPPHHQYVAFYEYLRQRGVHACIHIGSRGTGELLPGKHLGLSGECFGDLLTHHIPQIHVCTVAAPGSVLAAKRRWHSLVVTHHVPDFCRAGLWGPYAELRVALDEASDLSLVGEARRVAAHQVLESAAAAGLVAADIEEIAEQLSALDHARIPHGLHVLGRPKDATSLKSQVARMLERRLAGVEPSTIARRVFGPEHVREGLAYWAEEIVDTGSLPDILDNRLPRHEAKALAEVLSGVSHDYSLERELGAVMGALSGRFVTPGPTGDGMRTPAIYPTGRNGVAPDPTRMPMPVAVARGSRSATAMLERFEREHGRRPASVALVLTGSQSARTGGEVIGQALHLVGGRMIEGPGWLPVFEPVPQNTPRTEVLLAMCASQRDMYPLLHRELDLLLTRALGQPNARPRIFGPAPTAYAAPAPSLAASAKGDRSHIAEAFVRCMGYAYGANQQGQAAPDQLRAALAEVELVCLLLDGDDVGLCDDELRLELFAGLCAGVEQARGCAPVAYVLDTCSAQPRVFECGEALSRFVITRLLNPVWIDGMLKHNRHGAQQIEQRIRNVVALSCAVSPPPWLFPAILSGFYRNAELRVRLAANNPNATAALAGHLRRAVELGLMEVPGPELEELTRWHELLCTGNHEGRP